MIQVSVMYPRKEGAPFDLGYYLDSHMPMVSARLGSALKGFIVVQGISGDTADPSSPYTIIAHLNFDSLESFNEVFPKHEKEFMDDIKNYTSISPIIQISEVRSSL